MAEVERAFQNARGIPGENLEALQAEDLKQAVAVYQGELLQGWYQDWCLCERERFRDMYLAMLDKLMATVKFRAIANLAPAKGNKCFSTIAAANAPTSA